MVAGATAGQGVLDSNPESGKILLEFIQFLENFSVLMAIRYYMGLIT